jgi:hypothetical protein
MKRSLSLSLAFVGALALPTLAAADWGTCHIYCSNGSTYGPYGSSSTGCCVDFEDRCGSQGSAYTVVGSPPYQGSIVDCLPEEHLAAGWKPGAETSKADPATPVTPVTPVTLAAPSAPGEK